MNDYLRMAIGIGVAVAAMVTTEAIKPEREFLPDPEIPEITEIRAAQLGQTEREAPVILLDPMIEDTYLREDVPLSLEEQRDLYGAALEFDVPYEILLGLIERETRFTNAAGDSGRSQGYCQIQKKWWGSLMDEIGAEDLTVPKDNFRTAAAILRYLTDRFGSLEDALTAYNTGHSGQSTYADGVMENAERWDWAR